MSKTKKKPWDCHRHKEELKVSDAHTVYHPVHGQLCYAESHYDVYLYFPIKFDTKQAAWKWILDGCIADIQEELGTLQVGFVTACAKKRKESF